jgi:hypothetical protein
VPGIVADDGSVITTEPDRFFSGVPARDLEAADIANLTDEQLASITGTPPGGDPLYTDPDARKSESAAKKSSPSKSQKRSGHAPSRTPAAHPAPVIEDDATLGVNVPEVSSEPKSDAAAEHAGAV